MKKMRRLLSCLLAVVVIAGVIPFTAVSVSAANTIDGITYEISNEEVTITGYTGSETEVVIPATIEDFPVTAIGTSAFYEKSNLTSISIPAGIKSIGDYAFHKCTSITELVLPEGVVSIGSNAFSECTNLAQITYPSSVASVAGHTLKDTAYFNNEANWENGALYSGTVLTNVKTYYTGIIREGTTVIAASAFYYCTGFSTIDIPDSVVFIGDYAFSGCSSLSSITIPGSVKHLGEYLFFFCSGLGRVVLENGVESIGYRAFYTCQILSTVTIPKTVTSIAESAFQGSNFLSKVYYAGNSEKWANIEIGNFNDPLVSSEIVFLNEPDAPEGLSYEIADGEVTITGYTGSETELVIPDAIDNGTVTKIADSAFFNCTDLVSVSIPEGVAEIGDSAFFNCTSLTTVNIPEGVTSIGDYAFAWCTSLTEISIPNGVTSIGKGTFYECESLTGIRIPEGVTDIGENAFSYCSELTDVQLPESIANVDNYAFYECTSIAEIAIPAGVKSIGEGAFLKCPALENVYYEGSPNQWSQIVKGDRNDYFLNVEMTFGEIDAPEFKVGDLTMDGEVNAKDINVLIKLVSGMEVAEEGSALFFAADIDGDNVINSRDANFMKRILAGDIQL